MDQLQGLEHINLPQEHQEQQEQVEQVLLDQVQVDHHQAQQDQVDHILHHLDTATEEEDNNEEVIKYDLSWFIFIVSILLNLIPFFYVTYIININKTK